MSEVEVSEVESVEEVSVEKPHEKTNPEGVSGAERVDKAEKDKAVKFNVKNTEEVIALGLGLAKVLRTAKQNDGRIDAGDLGLLVNLFPLLGPAVEDLSLVDDELKDLDSAEAKRLLQFVASHVAGVVEDEDKKKIIEKSIEAVAAISELVFLLVEKSPEAADDPK